MNKDWLKLATFALSKCKSDKNPLLSDNSEKPASHTNNEFNTKEKPNESFPKPQELAEKKGGSPFWLENNQKMNSDPTVGEETIDRKKNNPKLLEKKSLKLSTTEKSPPKNFQVKYLK